MNWISTIIKRIVPLALALAVSSANSAVVTVNMANIRFDPPNTTISVGDSVRWVNSDFVSHDTTSGTNGVPSGVWKSTLFGHNGSYTNVFNVPPGYYGYYCTPHYTFGMIGSVTVLPANLPPSVSITNPADGALFFEGDTVTVQAIASDSDGSIASVSFTSSGTPIGTATLPPYQVTLNNLPGGAYAFQAIAVDNQNASATSAVVHVTIDRLPLISITNPVNGDKIPVGTNVLVQTDASDPDGSVSKVEFFTNGVSAAVLLTPPFQLTLAGLDIGIYTLIAKATDNLGASSDSAPVTFEVFIPPQAPSILRAPQSQTGQVGTAVSFSVTAAGTPPLNFQWRFNNNDIGGATNDTLLLPSLQTNQAGIYVVVVTNNFGSVTSLPAHLEIALAPNVPPTVSISSPPNGARFPLHTNVPLVANAHDSDGTVTRVEFLTRTNSFQTNLLGIVTQPPFSLVLSNLALGDYTILARATDDGGGVTLSSEFVFFVVGPPITTLTLSPNQSALALGTNILLTAAADTTVTNIVILANGTILATGVNSPLTFNWRPQQTGSYTLVARSSDTLGQTSESQPIVVRIFQRELIRPTLTITNAPQNFARLSSPEILIEGIATDNIGLDHVEFSINDGAYFPAEGTNNWRVRTNLLAGLDTVRVRSVDLAGNASFDAARFYTYVFSSPLRIVIEGSGAVSPDLNGVRLESGKVFSLTAHPAPGQLFIGWAGVSNSGSTSLRFVMQPNLVLTARFATNPFLPVAGGYSGLFFNTNELTSDNSGFFNLQLGKSGTFTGTLLNQRRRLAVRGKFDLSGHASFGVPRRGISPLAVSLNLDLEGTNGISGEVTTKLNDNVVTSDLDLRPNVASHQPNSQAGPHWISFQDAASGTQTEAGAALAGIAPAGRVMIQGTLQDQSVFTASTTLTRDGACPVFCPLVNGTEILIGWLNFPGMASSVDGVLYWELPDGTQRTLIAVPR